MKILIENAETLQFLHGAGQWTKSAGDGTGFSSSREAMLAGKKEPIGKFNVVWQIGATGQFINMDHGSGKGA